MITNSRWYAVYVYLKLKLSFEKKRLLLIKNYRANVSVRSTRLIHFVTLQWRKGIDGTKSKSQDERKPRNFRGCNKLRVQERERERWVHRDGLGERAATHKRAAEHLKWKGEWMCLGKCKRHVKAFISFKVALSFWSDNECTLLSPWL